MSARFRKVAFWEPGVAFEQMGVLDTKEQKIAGFGDNHKDDDLSDVIEEMTNGDTEWMWTDVNRVRVEHRREEVPGT